MTNNVSDGLLTKFSTSSLMQQGDYFMDQSRDLLMRHLQLFEVHQQDAIRLRIDDVRDFKDSLENFSGSRLQRLLEARKYRRLSKVTYKNVKNASDRALDNFVQNQFAEAFRPPGDGVGSGPDTASVPQNSSHVISTLTDIPINDLDRVEMSTYHAETTDGAAVVLDLFAQDESVQHVVATFPTWTEAFSGDRADSGDSGSQSIAPEVPAALSIHREDGTMPRFVTASTSNISLYQRANEGVGTHALPRLISKLSITSTGSTVASITSTELFGLSDGTRSSLELH